MTLRQQYEAAKAAYDAFEREWSRRDGAGELSEADGQVLAVERDRLWEIRRKAHTAWLASDED